MTDSKDHSDLSDLRQRAEARAPAEDLAGELSPEEGKRLIHELQVHKIELEMQNEELRQAQLLLAESRDKYADLYDSAPVGYLTLDRSNKIRQANLTAAVMLGVERARLEGRYFSEFLGKADQQVFRKCLAKILQQQQQQQQQQFQLVDGTGGGRVMLLNLSYNRDAEDQEWCRIAMTDITELKWVQEELRLHKLDLERQVAEQTSELRQANVQLGESTERLEALFQASPLAIGVFDEQGRVVNVNPAAERMFGWPLAELQGRVPPSIPEADAEASRELLQLVLRGESLVGVEITQKRRDGSRFAASLSTAPLRGPGGNIQGFVALAEDITERKAKEEALRTQARVLANMAEGVTVTDHRGTMLYTNPAFDAMFGYEAGELSGQHSNTLNAYPPAENQALIQAIMGQVRTTGAWHGEIHNRKKDGSSFYTKAHISSVSINGKTLYISVQEDITERKRSEEALRQERDFNAALLNTLGALVVVLDREGRIVVFNQACETSTGYTFAEVEGRYFFDIFLAPEEKAAVKEVFQLLNGGEFPLNHENYWLSRSGEKRLISWANTTINDNDGAISYIIGTGIDITRQRQAEEALRQAHSEMEQRVAARTEQLRHTVDSLLQEIAERERAETRLQESEARFAAFMRHLPGSAIMRDREGRFLFANEAWEKILGRQPGESLGKTVDDFWPAAIADRLKALDQEVFDRNQPIEAVVELPVAGEKHTFLSHRFPIRGEAGRVEMVGAIGIDITDRLKAEETRDRLIEILEATPDFVGSADREGRLFYLNRAAREMLGLNAGNDITTMTYVQTMPDWAVDLVLTQGRPIYAREGFWQGESAIRRGDGTEIPVSQVILAHRSPEGRIKFFSTICRDISDRKRTEEKLRKSEEKLRQLTIQLLTAQEDERKRLAAELHDELGHALLTLKLHLSGVEQHLLPEQADLKEKMSQMVHYLTDTVEEVRRLYYALSPGDLEDLGLTTALRTMVEDFQEIYEDIDWQIDLADIDGLFPLHIQTMIYRIVQEALTNIGKHADPEHVKVTVTRKDLRAVFVIEDDGRGFSMDDVLEGDKRGMGLAAMAQRVHLAGGIFDLWSRENQGARIIFSIPFAPAEEKG